MPALLAGACLALACLPACERQKPSAPAAPEAAPVSLRPWTWHTLGGILIIEGELGKAGTLELKGRTYAERRAVEAGPLRWELYLPPMEEPAVLKLGDGTVLATWDFRKPPPEPPAPPEPRPAPAPAVQEPKPAPVPGPKPTKPVLVPAKPIPAPQPLPAPLPARPQASASEPAASVKAAGRPARMDGLPRPGSRPDMPGPGQLQPEPPERAKTQTQARGPQLGRLELDRRLPAMPQPRPLPTQPAPAPHPVPLPKVDPVPQPVVGGPLWPGAGEGLNFLRGRQGARRVCLSFDGGSAAEVAVEVLDTLKARGVRTTIFLTGAFIQRFPDLVRRMDREGHEIGNHTMNHPHFAPNYRRDPAWTRERIHQELLEADRALLRVLGRPMDPVWRAPYGEHTAEIRKWAEELGYRHIGWSEGADTLDWATVKERRLYRTGDAILERLRGRMERPDGDGLIVLMHLGSGRPDADRPSRNLGAFMDQALKAGWRFVPVGAFLADSGRAPWRRDGRMALLQGALPGRGGR